MAVTSPAPSALSATAASMRRRLPRSVTLIAVLCSTIALVLTAMGSGTVGNFVYSFAIGLSCWLVIDGSRLLIAAIVDRLRARRALAPAGAIHIGWVGTAVLILAAIVLGPTLGLWIGDALLGFDSPNILQLESTGTRVTLAMAVLGTLVGTIALTTLERLANARAQAEAAQRTAAETQLRLLQSQLEPHMLFNTLANLRVLIGSDPARAQAMLDRLIAFLRATLKASRTDLHPLAQEFERVADYLALMAVRMGPRLASTLDLPPALRDLPVPPLLLQPLVENSIQHGLEPQVGGGHIDVRAERVGEQLHLSVRDTGAGLDVGAQGGTGFGVQQVRERLRTLYGGAATLTLGPAEGGGTMALIRLPMPT